MNLSKKQKVVFLIFPVLLLAIFSFKKPDESAFYSQHYREKVGDFIEYQNELIEFVKGCKIDDEKNLNSIQRGIWQNRLKMKGLDFWLRYLEPLSYKKINGPLPVEWETEVFEKFEKPYRREGAGYTLAALYLEEPILAKDSLIHLLLSAQKASDVFLQDSITSQLSKPDHFYFCNRLFLLNLAAIYTTGFECPDPTKVIPELEHMLLSVQEIYKGFNQSYPSYALSTSYLDLYRQSIAFVKQQPKDITTFDHFVFLRDYVNPLFSLNQQFIREYDLNSKSVVDYSLNKNVNTIFSKQLYNAQNVKGIYLRVYDQSTLAKIEQLGKMLFYDPILSVNNQRSCASCHKPEQYFTDTLLAASLQLDAKNNLPRNSPSLINTPYNHLIMADGKHLGLQEQVKAVVSNSLEMGETEETSLKKVLSCKEYKTVLYDLLKVTPQEKEVTFEHLASAITFYYSKFSKSQALFDRAMNKQAQMKEAEVRGFNLFMSKAQCATCHFVPQFNGVKPPYVGSEFEVLGVPLDTNYKSLSKDVGRYGVNPAFETHGAFRTGSLRNSDKTKPYMHNGVFTSMEQVIEFYNGGGGAGRGLTVPNQTLSSDSLGLSASEKQDMKLFLKSLNEDILFEAVPEKLPLSKNKSLNTRKVGGVY